MRKKLHVLCQTSGFTLIELLIVIAIIAILASIAIPNFLEAQTRSKITRVKSDLRTIAMGLEAYFTDNNIYPPCHLAPSRFRRLVPLSTPIAYISSVPHDIFQTVDPNAGSWRRRGNYGYGSMPINMESRWCLVSDGPDLIANASRSQIQDYPGWDGSGWTDPTGNNPFLGKIWDNPDPACPFQYYRYDPTNGTISSGDIWRVSDHTME